MFIPKPRIQQPLNTTVMSRSHNALNRRVKHVIYYSRQYVDNSASTHYEHRHSILCLYDYEARRGVNGTKERNSDATNARSLPNLKKVKAPCSLFHIGQRRDIDCFCSTLRCR